MRSSLLVGSVPYADDDFRDWRSIRKMDEMQDNISEEVMIVWSICGSTKTSGIHSPMIIPPILCKRSINIGIHEMHEKGSLL